MNNESKIQEISKESYKGYELRITKLQATAYCNSQIAVREAYSVYAISDRNNTLRKKYPSHFSPLQGEYYSVHNLEQAEAYVATIKAKIDAKVKARQDRLAEKAKAREGFVNPYKVGDILYSSWGYEQTNREFYQIVAVGNRSLKLRQIGSVSVRDTSWCSEDITPAKDKFITEEINRVNLVINSYNGKTSHRIKSPIYGNLYKYEGGTLNRSWGH